MKLKIVFLFALMSGLAFGAQASDRGLTVLDDHQMAAITGGFCVFEYCEDAPGSGVCQPEPPNQAALCALTICKYTDVSLPGLDILGCSTAGKETCSINTTYRQCIQKFAVSACSSATDMACGVEVHSWCTLNQGNRGCNCVLEGGEDQCDWSNCSPGL